MGGVLARDIFSCLEPWWYPTLSAGCGATCHVVDGSLSWSRLLDLVAAATAARLCLVLVSADLPHALMRGVAIR